MWMAGQNPQWAVVSVAHPRVLVSSQLKHPVRTDPLHRCVHLCIQTHSLLLVFLPGELLGRPVHGGAQGSLLSEDMLLNKDLAFLENCKFSEMMCTIPILYKALRSSTEAIHRALRKYGRNWASDPFHAIWALVESNLLHFKSSSCSAQLRAMKNSPCH